MKGQELFNALTIGISLFIFDATLIHAQSPKEVTVLAGEVFSHGYNTRPKRCDNIGEGTSSPANRYCEWIAYRKCCHSAESDASSRKPSEYNIEGPDAHDNFPHYHVICGGDSCGNDCIQAPLETESSAQSSG